MHAAELCWGPHTAASKPFAKRESNSKGEALEKPGDMFYVPKIVLDFKIFFFPEVLLILSIWENGGKAQRNLGLHSSTATGRSQEFHVSLSHGWQRPGSVGHQVPPPSVRTSRRLGLHREAGLCPRPLTLTFCDQHPQDRESATSQEHLHPPSKTCTP